MTAPLLSLRGVGKSYWRGLHELRVLSDVMLDVHPGEMVAIWGRRGSGKTTLLRVAAGLQGVDSGEVLFDGMDLAALSDSQRAHVRQEQIGWVRRTGPRSSLRILDYVALPLMARNNRRDALRHTRETLTRLGVSECAHRHWAHISDGERALVGIAHAVVRSPRLLLVDDPTACLGMEEREAIADLLRSLAEEQRMGVLLAAPDMPTTMSSHHIRALSGGRLLTPPQDPVTEGARVIEFPPTRRTA